MKNRSPQPFASQPFASQPFASMKGLGALLVLSVLPFTLSARAWAGDRAASPADPAPTVVELFTSQGCSSCPPADALLGDLARRPDVVALSFHVDYWDRLGWPDPHATAWGTDRQRAYAQRMTLSYVYTPQMVIDGRTDVAGSRPAQVMAALEASRNRAGDRVSLSLERRGDTLTVSLPQVPEGETEARLTLLSLIPRTDNAVSRGENAGRHLTHVNVVRSLRDLGPWDGRAETWEIPLSGPELASDTGLALLIQRRDSSGAPGPVLGAGIVE
ncbi:MAG: DUF1223 domain-containing protein [Rhodospirillum sp.]|nr:DUF1223 domain-containing protein [Rhodospirillum sp.]MCF8488964.1 DUF1223 domain-containing protein [Rhodospirillum sp.]MCF8500005.1 DUF1223 domain-containing protein [Rhodospirillum sp.]